MYVLSSDWRISGFTPLLIAPSVFFLYTDGVSSYISCLFGFTFIFDVCGITIDMSVYNYLG